MEFDGHGQNDGSNSGQGDQTYYKTEIDFGWTI